MPPVDSLLKDFHYCITDRKSKNGLSFEIVDVVIASITNIATIYDSNHIVAAVKVDNIDRYLH